MNRINIICLGVRDMEKSLKFYKHIGFQTYEKENSPAVVFFDNQGTAIFKIWMVIIGRSHIVPRGGLTTMIC